MSRIATSHKEIALELSKELAQLLAIKLYTSALDTSGQDPAKIVVCHLPNVNLSISGSAFEKETSSNMVPNTPQGKVAELRQELNSGGKKDKNHSAKKIALKKIVANMTMSNNDMVGLFPDIIACMQTPSLEIKKMWVLLMSSEPFRLITPRCFLYLVNYARMKPDVALKALPVLLEVRPKDFSPPANPNNAL